MSGRGEVGAGGGPAGDLYVEIVEEAHEYLVRDGDTLHMQIDVSMVAASLGTTVTVESLDGPVDVQIKPGTQSGTPVVIKGKGMTRLRRGLTFEFCFRFQHQQESSHQLFDGYECDLRRHIRDKGS